MSYSNIATITINNNKVEGNLTNFPMLFSGTYDGTGNEPDLRSSANGGNIQNVDSNGGAFNNIDVPADLIFSQTAGNGGKLSFEVEKYDATTGEIVAWVKIPSLSSSTDTSIYVLYNDGDISTSQEDVNNTWDSNFTAVYHCNINDAGFLRDSTSYSNTLAGNSVQIAETTGQVDGAYEFNGNSGGDGGGGQSEFDTQTPTLQYWLKYPTVYTYEALAGYGDMVGGAVNTKSYMSEVGNDTGLNGVVWSLYGPNGGGGSGGLCSKLNYDIVSSPTSDWNFFAGTFDGDSTSKFYKNDTDINTDSSVAGPLYTGSPLLIAQKDNELGVLHGFLDEIRFSDIERSQAWIITDYNTQSDPSTFYTISLENSAIKRSNIVTY